MRSTPLKFEEFELDPLSYELRFKGSPVKLERMPMELLLLLASRPGELVTRAEIIEKLWGKDVFLDTDNSINTAIRKIRLALHDDPDQPHFVLTVPGRGYRFIAPIEGKAAEDEVGALEPRAASGTAPPAYSRRVFRMGMIALLIVAATIGTVVLRHFRSRTTVASSRRVMLAVLPFQNLSGDPQQEYFSDGMTEEMITDLGQLNPAKLGVIARTSAMAYKTTKKTASEIGRELGVNYLLEGSVRREGDSVRLSAQLIRVDDGTHVWAQSYDREVKHVLRVQEELGDAVAQQVQVHLESASRHPTVDPEAYDLYLRGRFYWNQRTPESLKKSITYYEQATARDTNFAMAYAGLANSYNFGQILGISRPKESFPKARLAAKKALELDALLGEAHTALAFELSHFEFDWKGAEQEFLRGIELTPNSAYAHLFYGNSFLMPMGRHEEAITEIKKAAALDPLSLPTNMFLAAAYSYAGEDDKALQQFRYTIDLDPNFPVAHQYLSAVLEHSGRLDESISEREKEELLTSSPDEVAAEIGSLRKALSASGPTGYWKLRLRMEKQEAESPSGGSEAYGVASIYAELGDADQAFFWLEKAYQDRDGSDLNYLNIEPQFAKYRSDPRFKNLAARIGLPH
jgi:TolB-like protein/DNA-binding winged helix-turn-helix (wHTH) protein/tetratricopeptide (TPR) repeat protein